MPLKSHDMLHLWKRWGWVAVLLDHALVLTCMWCAEMFATAQKTTELWMWKMEYLHHEQRPLYFGEWF